MGLTRETGRLSHPVACRMESSLMWRSSWSRKLGPSKRVHSRASCIHNYSRPDTSFMQVKDIGWNLLTIYIMSIRIIIAKMPAPDLEIQSGMKHVPFRLLELLIPHASSMNFCTPSNMLQRVLGLAASDRCPV
jgi:hypothetical protein